MIKKIPLKQSFSLLRTSVVSLFKNPQILYPFALLAFCQLLLMQVLFFAPRFPLSVFFGPIIMRLKGPQYMHYPLNFDLMNHWFQSAQAFIFIFLSSLLIGQAIMMVARINRGEPVEEKLPKVGLKKYVNMMAAFLLVFCFMYGLTSLYGLLIKRALQISSTSGIYFIIRQIVLIGAPYFNLLFSIIVTSLLAYVLILIVLEDQNIFIAVVKNFQLLFASFWTIFVVVAISTLFYLPILLMRSNYRWFSVMMDPEGWQIFVILGLFVMLFIDAVQYTAITLCYFLTKE